MGLFAWLGWRDSNPHFRRDRPQSYPWTTSIFMCSHRSRLSIWAPSRMEQKQVSAGTPKVYPSIGACIYCGDQNPIRSREHVIPRGLGSGFVFLKASCETCRKITHAFETACLRKIFLPFRLRTGLVNHPSDIPQRVPLTFAIGRQKAGRHVLTKRHPRLFIMPVFREMPGIVMGKPPTTEVHVDYQIFWERSASQEKRMKEVMERNLPATVHFNMTVFMKMVAKIAHGFAVGEIGIENFKPVLTPFILGNEDHLELGPWFIGLSNFPLEAGTAHHQLAWGVQQWEHHWLAVVRVRLLSQFPTQAYNVVAGVFTPAGRSRYGLPRLVSNRPATLLHTLTGRV